jgi:hypothetical protein
MCLELGVHGVDQHVQAKQHVVLLLLLLLLLLPCRQDHHRADGS